VTVLISSYVVRIKTMWRQAPITAAVVIASGLVNQSTKLGAIQGLHKVGEVIFGCAVGLVVSLVMTRVWLIEPPKDRAAG
jgi:acid phosphatase family membrane protein YuiD